MHCLLSLHPWRGTNVRAEEGVNQFPVASEMPAGLRRGQGFLESQNCLMRKVEMRNEEGDGDGDVTKREWATVVVVVVAAVAGARWLNGYACVRSGEQGVEQDLNLIQDLDGCGFLAAPKIALGWNWLVLLTENTD